MTKNTSISIGSHFNIFVQLRLLRRALAEGEQSGWAEDFDPEEFKARMKGKTK